MVTELSQFNLNIAFLDFISRSYRSFSDNRWILAACAHCLLFSVKFNLGSFVRRLNVVFMPLSAY